MKLFGPLYDRVLNWSRHPKAPWYLGGLSFAESSFFPIPPDVMLAPMALAKPERWLRLALITTLASVAGGLLGYLIGWGAMDAVLPWVERMGHGDKLNQAQSWFERWGFWAILLAGFSPIPYKAFTIASLIGRGGRFFLVAFLMARLGPAAETKLKPMIEWLGWGTVALAVGAYLALR